MALAKALDVSLAYLLDTQGIELSVVEFRTKANTTGRDRAHVESEVLEWIERYLQVEAALDLDSAQWQSPFTPRQLRSVAEGEDLANDVRNEWKLGIDPIRQAEARAEHAREDAVALVDGTRAAPINT